MRVRIDYKQIPIFINARDLTNPLRRLIAWLLEAGYTNIYILDNASSNPALLDFYSKLSRDVTVIPLGTNAGRLAIWDLNILGLLNVTGPYVWTDPDIVPSEECPSNVLEFFSEVLHAFPNKAKVGFGLRIDDLPEHYRFKQKVIAWESQFWMKRVTPKLYDADIDTTFALYRPGSGFDMSALRSGFPYLARHHPWYENSERPSDDHVYYVEHAKPGLNNWSGGQLPEWLDLAISQRFASL
jgi:hypothetical protein